MAGHLVQNRLDRTARGDNEDRTTGTGQSRQDSKNNYLKKIMKSVKTRPAVEQMQLKQLILENPFFPFQVSDIIRFVLHNTKDVLR